ncbi:Protein of unknown function DUF900 [Babesia duncani]|uniref:Uncharacterized protein n=1 Tax=Babesia duncani TaxID=323732 RepID=A0AAD9UQL1_9APIC|nr:Protein of unknown function DUF900 [Babesia duncani]
MWLLVFHKQYIARHPNVMGVKICDASSPRTFGDGTKTLLSKENVESLSFSDDSGISRVNSVIGEMPSTYKELQDPSSTSIAPPPYKNLMLHSTVQFMDYRRLKRRFNGIRKPISTRKAICIAFIALFFALLPFIRYEISDEQFLIGIAMKRSLNHYLTSPGFVIGVYFLACWQLNMPLKLPVTLSYVFIIGTLVTLFVMRDILQNQNFIWVVFAVYTLVQLAVLGFSQALVYLGPLLALNGLFFPCSEHLHLLRRSQRGSKLNVTISRYNDYSVMCGVHTCGICMCAYRSIYRCIFWCLRKYNARIMGKTFKSGEAPFSHQMRYNGEVDENSLPHGYGEWIEDHSYGERLKGFWWHGYPIGPFCSQEIGSGSIFTNTRVAFVTDTRMEASKLRYGVTCTECSMSGHFFREFPQTYFFNPLYNTKQEPRVGHFYSKIPLFSVLNPSFSQIAGASVKWCIRMLKSQFYLNMPNSNGTVSLYVDKISNSLRIEGYRRIRMHERRTRCDEITIRLTKPPSVRTRTDSRLGTGIDTIRVGNRRRMSSGIVRLHPRATIEKSASVESVHATKEPVADIFYDEDDWETSRNRQHNGMAITGWIPIRTFGYVAQEAVIYIHGYNVSLAEACSQMAHIVSFSKLPPYILPFVFNWDGKHWGYFSAFSYPKAVACAEHPNVPLAFQELLGQLRAMDIKHVHFIIHSCGARVFFKVFKASVAQGLFTPVTDGGTRIQATTPVWSSPLQMDTCILLNPDYPMQEFRNVDYFVLRSYCNNIVIYADTRDQCLQFSEWYNRTLSLGRSIFAMYTTPQYLTLLNTELEPEIERMRLEYFARMPPLAIRKEYTMYSQAPNSSDSVIEATAPSPWPDASFFDNVSMEQRWLWLDLDVIDTSMIDTNVDFLKHSLYQMKREIMDDLREVILLRTRAGQRQCRLDRRRGNVFVFRVAPAGVGNLFARR